MDGVSITMFPGIDMRQAQKMMKRMGVQQQDIPATEVIIRTPETDIIIKNPSVAKVNLLGQESFQITGAVEERSRSTQADINDEDIATVMEQTGLPKDSAMESIKRHQGNLAAAILESTQKDQ